MPAPTAGDIVIHSKAEAAPGWAVAYGQEFWRHAAKDVDRAKDDDDAIVLPSGLNLGDVIERVSLAVRRDDGEAMPGVPTRTYEARFDGLGLRISPHLPIEGLKDGTRM